jgi:hypothetical protein
MAEPVIFFSHIPKTAGSTLLRIIRSQYPPEQILNLYRVTRRDAFTKVQDLADTTRMIIGHMSFSLCSHIRRPFRAITIFRDPVERVLSLYYYIAGDPTHPCHAAVGSGEMTLLDLARMDGNCHILWFSGQDKDTGLAPAELLALAKEKLVAENVEFGLTERFDETLILFSRKLNWNVKAYMSQNVTVNRPKRGQISPADLNAVESACAPDMELYAFARESFEQNIAQQPPEFSAEVARLRRRSVAKRIFHAFASRLSFGPH